MKKIFLSVIICIFTLSVLTFSVCAANDVTVVLDGKRVAFDVAPQIIDGRTMVPIRAIFEALGAEVSWDSATQSATATIDDYIVKCTLGSKNMTAYGKTFKMDVSPVIVGGRTLVPARFAAEAFGGVVSWDGATRTVYITSAAALEVPKASSVLCKTHSFDVRGYCTACGFASDYSVVDIDDTPYIVTVDGAEKRLRGYAVESVMGRLSKGDTITVLMKVINPFGGVWYMAEKDGGRFLVYSGDVKEKNQISFVMESASDISEDSFTIHATCNYTTKKPDYIAIYLGTGSTLGLVAETSEINGSNGSFTITCNVGRLKELTPDTTYFYQIHAYSDGTLFKSEARAATTSPAPVTEPEIVFPEMTEEPEVKREPVGYKSGFGTAKNAWGRTVIVSVFANDADSSWDHREINDLKKQDDACSRLVRACNWLESEFKRYGADSKIICNWKENPDLFYRVNMPAEDSGDLNVNMYRSIYGVVDSQALMKKYQADNLICIFFLDKDGRCSAPISTSYASYEYDFIRLYYGGYDTEEAALVSTYAHEILHCFGAYDLYKEEGVSAMIPDGYKDYVIGKDDARNDDVRDIMYYTHLDDRFETHNYLSEIDAYFVGIIPYCSDVDAWGLPHNNLR